MIQVEVETVLNVSTFRCPVCSPARSIDVSKVRRPGRRRPKYIGKNQSHAILGYSMRPKMPAWGLLGIMVLEGERIMRRGVTGQKLVDVVYPEDGWVGDWHEPATWWVHRCAGVIK